MNWPYRVREFARLAGITVKTLRHYERLGLLKPGRSGAGYRLYGERHLERLEQILALKFLGLPLREIRAALDRTPRELPEALRMQRRALAEKQERIGRAIRAIEAAERDPGTPALQKVIEVIKVQDAIDAMKKYYSSDQEWEKRKRYYEEGPGPEWRALYRDAAALVGEDPASEPVQAVAGRWLALTVRAANGDLEVQQDSAKAWMDREHWPEPIKARMAEFRLEEVAELVRQAALCSRKKYFNEAAWDALIEIRKRTGYTPPTWQAHVDLFQAAEAALAGGATDDEVRRLRRQWMALFDQDSGGAPAVKEGLLRCWADRRNWSEVVRWREEGLHRMTGEPFDRVADFLDRAMY